MSPTSAVPVRPEEAIRAYMAQNKPAVGRLLTGVFEIHSLDEAEKLSTMLALNYPDSNRVASGIWELISNAVEHGNLGIDYDEKARLLTEGRFADEVASRLERAPWRDRVVTVDFRRRPGAIRLKVVDQGAGFDYRRFLKAEPRLDRPNGRGIAIASRLSFDRLTYRAPGNMVIAEVRTP
jgi:sigma-B regulation protein RsbU (phosphoserine phosphatase)